ncbi:MAG: hypothetical protein JWQ22_1415 [Devosia sp.]|nr:hypothetical protein [Devosia sp.]
MFKSTIRTGIIGAALCVLLLTPVLAQEIDFGGDTSEWANDGECDDPRFIGTGAADELVDADLMADATDCSKAFESGSVTLNQDYAGSSSDGADILVESQDDVAIDADSNESATIADMLATRIDFGDDSGEFANDGECDDPDFHGTGMAAKPSSANRMADASDCRAAFVAGNISLGQQSEAADVAAFDYGGDWSEWADDGECDDLRFEGPGADKKLLSEDMSGDATDCKALEATGEVTIRTVYTPEHAAGAPYDGSDIDFGDNTSSYADDDQCDDPRFEGPGAAATLLDSDLSHDSADCKAAFEAGTIVMRQDA